MYRFQVTCETNFGEAVCLVGSTTRLGSWDVKNAVPLKADHYPLWKSDVIDLSSDGTRCEYKYIKKTPGGTVWEYGNNRWVPIEAEVSVTVHDSEFGNIQLEPFSFHEYDDRPQLHDAAQGQMRILVIGSSVAEGFNSWRKQGWAWHLGQALASKHGYELINVSQSGANTQVTKERFDQVVKPWKPDIIIIALSLGNEGLAHCPAGERRAAQFRFEQGVLDLLRMAVSLNATPILGGVYPNGDFVPETYSILKETAATMRTWGVPIFDWLAELDDGNGRWKKGLWFDHAHPNSAGHRRMFECIDLGLFDPGDDEEPQLIRRRSSLSVFNQMERSTSRSQMDPLVQESQDEAQAAEAKRSKDRKTFENGKGFSVVVQTYDSGVAYMSIRNKTEYEYFVCPDWDELNDALASWCPERGTYVSSDSTQAAGPIIFVGPEGRFVNRVAFAPGADALFKHSFRSLPMLSV